MVDTPAPEVLAVTPAQIIQKAVKAVGKNIVAPSEPDYAGVHQLGEAQNVENVQKHALTQYYLANNVANVLRALVQVIFYITLMVALGTLGPTIIKILEWFF